MSALSSSERKSLSPVWRLRLAERQRRRYLRLKARGIEQAEAGASDAALIALHRERAQRELADEARERLRRRGPKGTGSGTP